MGELTQEFGLPIGSSIGQISEAQLSVTQLLLGASSLPTTGLAFWTNNGALTKVLSNGIDNGFQMFDLGATGGVADYIENGSGTVVGLNDTLCLSGYFSQSTANPISLDVRFELQISGGNAILATLDFNPTTGAIETTTPNVISAGVQQFFVNNIAYYRIWLAIKNNGTAGNQNHRVRVYPAASLAQPAAGVIFGGPQLEAGVTQPTAFIMSTGNSGPGPSILGGLPRQLLIPIGSNVHNARPATDYNVDPLADRDAIIVFSNNNGNNCNLCQRLANFQNVGMKVTLVVPDPTRPIIVNALGGDVIVGACFPAASFVTTFQFPFQGASAAGYAFGTTITLQRDFVQTWYVLAADAMPVFSGTGVPNNADGRNGQYYLRQDGGVGTHLYFKTGGAWAAII